MATKKSAKSGSSTTKKAAPKKAATKTTVRTSSESVKSQPAKTVSASTSTKSAIKIDSKYINIVLAELVGTFVLTTVALLTASETLSLFIGLTLVVLVMAIGTVSGAHVNPAVTFGLWASKKLKSIMLPFYWVAQFLGAMAAVVVINAVAGTKLNLSFGHFNEFAWPIFWIELIGTGIFLFGLTSVLRRTDTNDTTKALGVGLSLFVGLAIAAAIYAPMRQATISTIQNSDKAKTSAITASDLPHQLLVSGATLNPAVALASTETSASSLLGTGADTSKDTHYSRLGWEVILGTLIGAALGANLSRLVGHRFKD